MSPKALLLQRVQVCPPLILRPVWLHEPSLRPWLHPQVHDSDALTYSGSDTVLLMLVHLSQSANLHSPLHASFAGIRVAHHNRSLHMQVSRHKQQASRPQLHSQSCLANLPGQTTKSRLSTNLHNLHCVPPRPAMFPMTPPEVGISMLVTHSLPHDRWLLPDIPDVPRSVTLFVVKSTECKQCLIPCCCGAATNIWAPLLVARPPCLSFIATRAVLFVRIAWAQVGIVLNFWNCALLSPLAAAKYGF